MRSANNSLKQALLSNRHYQKVYSEYQYLKLSQNKPQTQAPQISLNYGNNYYNNHNNHKQNDMPNNNNSLSKYNCSLSAESNGYAQGCGNGADWESYGQMYRGGGMQFGCFDVSGLRGRGREAVLGPQSQSDRVFYQDVFYQPDPDSRQSKQ